MLRKMTKKGEAAMTMERDLKKVARLAGTAADLAASGQTAAMALLLAEMQALTSMMPGVSAHPVRPQTMDEKARALAAEAETEASFDNMPV